ncbi:uncharacterized protein LOC106155738 isoform X2 [Lingula anatina]|uniref:Uncharacterized protein LOC106155738 isoform X2 n=1 Tax=Lingula anatina TaxID=7574 RepID=A0A1S3HJH6_LINAN|nr:uncharacterized protein LOC106155738 isoform X2 [Lingula anatina]|eukprot:XP_013386167.1 uncharacterized protein LOC106155738 isoform X2 [Lingula anatina]
MQGQFHFRFQVYYGFIIGQPTLAVCLVILLWLKGIAIPGRLRVFCALMDPVWSFAALTLGMLFFTLPGDLALSSCVQSLGNETETFANCLKKTEFTHAWLLEKIRPVRKMTDHALAVAFLKEEKYIYGAVFLFIPLVIHVVSRIKQRPFLPHFVVTVLCSEMVLGELYCLLLNAFDVAENERIQTLLVIGTVFVVVGSNPLAFYPFFTFDENVTKVSKKTSQIDKALQDRHVLAVMFYNSVFLNLLMFFIQLHVAGSTIAFDTSLGVANAVFLALNVVVPFIAALVTGYVCQKRYCRPKQLPQTLLPPPADV